MNVNIKKLLAPTIIILVTFFAFLAGSLQADYNNRANTSQSLIDSQTSLITNMDSMVQSILASDTSADSQASFNYFTVINDVVGYLLTSYYNTTSMTNSDKATKLAQLESDLSTANFEIQSTNAFRIDEALNKSTIYYLATPKSDGFDFLLQTEEWTATISTETFENFLLHYVYLNSSNPIFGNITSPYSICFENGGYNQSDLCYLTNSLNQYSVYELNLNVESINLHKPLQDQIAIRDKASTNLLKYKNEVDAISRGVTITTIAVVLATSMNAGLENKELYNYLSEIRSDINKDPKYKMKSRSALTYIGLLIAVIIAVLGLGIPLLFS